MKNNNIFQKVLTGVFGVMGVLGVMAFAGYLPGFSPDTKEQSEETKIYGDVIIWGTLPSISLKRAIELYQREEKRIEFTYIEKKSDILYADLLEALVSGKGPDLLMISHDWLAYYDDKLVPVAYSPKREGETAIPERLYKDTYIEGAEIYLYDEGVMSFPMLVDPIVLYWNRDILSSRGVGQVPKLWEEFNSAVPKLTVSDSEGHIVRSANAMGEYRNVTNAKEILSLLLMQSGVPIVKKSGSSIEINMRSEVGRGAEDAIKFFMQFSNPKSDLYTWNRSLEESQNMFVSGDLAFYFGYASEAEQIRKMSPHLNFDVAVVPQSRADDTFITTGKIYGVGAVKNARNMAGAKWGALQLTSKTFLEILNEEYKLTPVRRDMISFYGADSNDTTFAQSALITKVWVDPEPEESNQIFSDMIQNIMSDRFGVAAAVSTAERQLSQL